MHAGVHHARHVVRTWRDQADGEDGQDGEQRLRLDHGQTTPSFLLMLPPTFGQSKTDWYPERRA